MYLLVRGLINPNLVSRRFQHLWNLGFGAITTESLANVIDFKKVSKERALLSNILIANSPQPILSFLFLTYNSLYTCMLLAQEWFDYAYERKSLRVTDPVGKQRSTYRLQIPYKYGIPLIVLSGAIHWLVSQSIFLVQVNFYSEEDVLEDGKSLTTLGYSNIAIIFTVLLGSITLLLGAIMGYRRFEGRMPLAASCSAAVSAACHQPTADVDPAELPLMWGVAEAGPDGDITSGVTSDDEYSGHCSFTSLPVLPPQEGQMYAGAVSKGT